MLTLCIHNHTHVYTFTHTFPIIHVYILCITCIMYRYTSTLTYTCTYIYIYIYTQRHIVVQAHRYIHTHTYACMHTYRHTRACMHECVNDTHILPCMQQSLNKGHKSCGWIHMQPKIHMNKTLAESIVVCSYTNTAAASPCLACITLCTLSAVEVTILHNKTDKRILKHTHRQQHMACLQGYI
jgi:hypothetical protein